MKFLTLHIQGWLTGLLCF